MDNVNKNEIKKVMPILPAGKIQGIFKLNKRIGRSLEFFANAKNRDDRFCLTPAVSSLQRHSEPQAKKPEKIILDNRILRFAFAPLRMTASVLTLSLLLSLNLSTAWAACNEGDFDCNGESGSSAYCCYHVVSETNGLKDIEIYKDPAAGNNPAKVGESAFDVDYGRGQDIGTVVIKEGINEVDTYAFYGAENLTSIDMPNVTSIGVSSFENARLLTNVNIPNITSIERAAFLAANALHSINIPGITSLNGWPFDQTSLNDVNCLGTAQECAALKTLMQSTGATFSDSQFHIIDTPTANCSGYSQGVCSTCSSGYTLNNGECQLSSQGTGSSTTTAASCTNGASIGGTCFPRRYTPAEIAELVGESNTILLYYK